MVQTCWNINVHVVNTDICLDLYEYFMDSMRKQTYLCALYKLKSGYKTYILTKEIRPIYFSV